MAELRIGIESDDKTQNKVHTHIEQTPFAPECKRERGAEINVITLCEEHPDPDEFIK